IADFLGLPPPLRLEMNADVQRRKTIDLLASWCVMLARPQPLVIVVEDLHWCDASSLVLLQELASRAGSSSLLLVATMRPGSVPGREFSWRLLRDVAGLEDAALQHGLESLVEAEILFVRGAAPDGTYMFKHALVQEAAYGSLLKKSRQQIHGRIVDVLARRPD